MGKVDGGKRDSVPATGGKDLGKPKGVSIDYLTEEGRGERISRFQCSPDPQWGPASIDRRTKTDRLGTRTKARGSTNPPNIAHACMHARTYAHGPSTHSCAATLCLCPRYSPIFLYPYRGTRCVPWTRFSTFYRKGEGVIRVLEWERK